MRSYQWRSQATRAVAPAAPGAALRDSAIRIAPPAARVAFSRVALLGSVWLGALVIVAPDVARAVDGTWQGPGMEWTTGTNWSSSPLVPDGVGTATFTNNSAPTSVTISNNAAINTIQFELGGAGLFVHRSERGNLHHQRWNDKQLRVAAGLHRQRRRGNDTQR